MVVVGGCVVVVVGGGAVVGVVVGVEGVDGEVDGVTGAVVPFVDEGDVVDVDGDFAGVLVVGVGVGVRVGVPLPPAVVGEDVVGAATDADDLPLDSTANQSFSTPCPLAWPFSLSLTKV